MNRKQQHAANARKAFVRPVVGPATTVGTSPARRVQTVTHVTGPMPRTRAMKGTAAMRGGDGKQSLWAQPADLSYSVAIVANDRRWTSTVADQG